jgi:hypothetical protein
MKDLVNYLESIVIKTNLKLYNIIDNIIEKYNYYIIEDCVTNDIRLIIMTDNNNSYNELTIYSTIIFNENLKKINNINITYNNKYNYILYLDY